jgi:crotonobetainyl-CoA:carnitine CoA-transferase CaiB-like acyl-CoA transferase
VLLENFKVGGLAKYGLDYPALSALNPRLVYCSITGFGQDGPYATRAGYDYMIQGMSGLMSITGQPEGEPQRVGVAVTDLFSGLYAVIGILAALRERDRTGRGQHLDIALLDCATAMLANQAMNFFATGEAPGRTGNGHPNIVPYQVFPVADGEVIVATGNDGQYRRFCEAVGRPALAADPAYATNHDRVARREALVPLLAEATRDWHRDDLLTALRAVGVPAGPINSIAQVFEDEQVRARGLHIRPEGVDGVRSPFRFSESRLDTSRTAPRLDQHGAEIRGKGFG